MFIMCFLIKCLHLIVNYLTLKKYPYNIIRRFPCKYGDFLLTLQRKEVGVMPDLYSKNYKQFKLSKL